MESLIKIDKPELVYNLGTIDTVLQNYNLTFVNENDIILSNNYNGYYCELNISIVNKIKEGNDITIPSENGTVLLLKKEWCLVISKLFDEINTT